MVKVDTLELGQWIKTQVKGGDTPLPLLSRTEHTTNPYTL